MKVAGRIILLLFFLMAACSVDSERPLTAIVAVETTIPAASRTAEPSPTITPTATITSTPPALPAVFSSPLIQYGAYGHTYIADVCTYLKNKWDPSKSAPGTVVMPIMIHSITDGEVTYYDQIHVNTWRQLVKDLRDQNFEAISMQQLLGFLQANEKIPTRSVLLIVDDRKTLENYNTHFRWLWEDYGWTFTNAWISHPETSQDLWDQNAQLQSEGWLDHQAHGVIHNINATEFSTDEFLLNEFQGSITAIQDHFGVTPIAYIWPGGSFTQHAVDLARQVGFKLGFTVNPRGPYMYNWIPLADQADPMTPSWLPDGYISDPLMVLPRFWSTDASWHIDDVRVIGQEASAYAAHYKQIELDYYNIVCAPSLGSIPGLTP